MHWVDVYAEKLLAIGKNHVVESGTSISGQPHLGSAADIIFADGISKAIAQKGGISKTVWAMDDLDGLRKVPVQLPKEFEVYLGQPAFKLPCPEGCCGSFVEHFTRPFLDSLARIDVRPEPISVAKKYSEGKYDKAIKLALEKASEIKEILKQTSGAERETDWLPFFPICEKCGKILTTQAYEFDGQKVKYRCAGGTAGKNFIPGCGHEGAVDIRSGKLPWRMEWAARWSILGVTCEPMGKDLTASGGTYETSSVLCERIFGHKAPLPVPYEWIVIGGKRFSKSAGRVLTLAEMTDIAGPEPTRYFFFRTQPTTHKEIDFEMAIPKLADDYELVERVYFGLEKNVPEKELDDMKRTYEISQLEGVPDKLFQVPYSHLISVVQTSVSRENMLETLGRAEQLTGLSEKEMKKLERKSEAVKRWLATHAPENVKFCVQKEHPKLELTPEEKKLLAAIHSRLEKTDWKAESIHDAVYSIAVEADIKAGQLFKLMYKIILAQERGPRLGYLLASLDRDFVLKRIKHFGQ